MLILWNIKHTNTPRTILLFLIAHTHTNLGIQADLLADLLAHQLHFRSVLVSRRSASVQSVLMRLAVHACFPRAVFIVFFFLPSLPPPLCLLLRGRRGSALLGVRLFFGRALIRWAASFPLLPFRGPNLILLSSSLFFSSSTLVSASAWRCRHNVISFLNWVNAAGPRDSPHV